MKSFQYQNTVTGEIFKTIVPLHKPKAGVVEMGGDHDYGDSIIFRRDSKGLGDIVTTLSAVQAVRRDNPNCLICYVANPPISSVLENHPDIDRLLTTEDRHPSGRFIDFSNPCPASYYESRQALDITKSRIQLFAEHAGVTDYDKPQLYTTTDEDETALLWLSGNVKKGKRVGVVTRCAEKWRDYEGTRDLIKGLNKKARVVVIDHEIKTNLPSTTGLSIRETMAIVKHLDLLVTPDTGWLHIAGALDVKILGLFGPTDPLFRLDQYGGDSEWLRGKCPYNRQPCWYLICGAKSEIQPCLTFSPKLAVTKALEMLTP